MRDIARYALAAIGTDMGVILNHFSAEIAVHGSSVERAATDCLLLVFNTRPSHPPVRRAARTRAGGAKRPLRSTKRPSAKSQKPVASSQKPEASSQKPEASSQWLSQLYTHFTPQRFPRGPYKVY